MNTMKNLLSYGVVFISLLSVSTSARAQLTGTWHWSYNQTVFHVDPTDNILVTATLFNDSTTDHVRSPGVGASFTGDLQTRYEFIFMLGYQFVDLDVPPSGNFPFTFGLLRPLGGSVPRGAIFQADPAFLGDPDHPPTNSFTIFVDGAPRPVPEPGTLPFVVGIAAMVALSSLFRRVRLVKQSVCQRS